MAGGVLVGDENGDAAACDTGFPPTPPLESESEPESDVSDAQQELDVIDDMEDAIELSHGLAGRFLETTWGSTCDCDEQSRVEPGEPAFSLDQMAQYWQTLGVPDAIGASLLPSMSAERDSTQLDWSSILSGGTNRPRLDIKSVICYASYLSINRGLYISYHPPVSRNMKTSVHIYHHSKALHTIPHFRLGSGRQSPQLGVFLFFPHITHAHRTTTYLTNGERQLWIDRLLLPAIRHLCPPDVIQHHPRSFADVESKTYSRRRETCSGLVRSNMDMLHYIPEQYLEGIWQHIGQNTDHPDLQQFRDMFVVLSAKNIKLEARSSTFEDCRSRITTHLRQILDWSKADLTRTWIDVGVEDTASHNSHTFLWRRNCLEAWTESLKHSHSHPLISSELFNFNLTEQAGSGRVELARAHPLRKQGILYAQRYNINKDIVGTKARYKSAWKEFICYLFRAIALEPRKRREIHNIPLRADEMTMMHHVLSLASRLQDQVEAEGTPNDDEGSESSWCEQSVSELGENTDADGAGVGEGSNDESGGGDISSGVLDEDTSVDGASDDDDETSDDDDSLLCEEDYGSHDEKQSSHRRSISLPHGTRLELAEALFQPSMIFWTHQCQTGVLDSSALVHFAAVMGIHRTSLAYRSAYNYTPSLAAVIYDTLVYVWPPRNTYSSQPERLQAIRTKYMLRGCHTPIGEILELKAFGKSIIKRDGYRSNLTWSLDGQSLTIGNDKVVHLSDFCTTHRDASWRVQEQVDEMMLGWKPTEDLSTIADDLTNKVTGWCFLDSPENGFLGKYKAMTRRAWLSSFRGAALAKAGQWLSCSCLTYLEAGIELATKIFVALHLTAGLPGRGTEITSTRLRNTNLAVVRAGAGQIIIVISYSKSRASNNYDFYTVRYLPKDLATSVLTYLTYIRPFIDFLANRLELPQFWSNEFLPRSGQLRTPWTLSLYKQAAIAIAKRYISELIKKRNFYYPTGASAPVNMIAAGVGHHQYMLLTTYAIDTALPPRLPPELLEMYRRLSTIWQDWNSQDAIRGRTPLGHALAWRNYLGKVGKSSVTRHQARWSQDGQTLTPNGVTLHMDQVPQQLVSECRQAHALFFDEPLFGDDGDAGRQHPLPTPRGGDLLLTYLAVVQPLRQTFLRQSKPGALLSPYLRATLDGEVWPDRRAAASITKAKLSPSQRANFDIQDMENPEDIEEEIRAAMAWGFDSAARGSEEPYRILTARMPVDALTADWSLARNRPIQEKHVDALCTIFQRGDIKRASYPLNTRSEVQCVLHRMGYDGDTPDADDDDVPSIASRPSSNSYPEPALANKSSIGPATFTIVMRLHPELNLALRMNRRDEMMADSYGDIWVQVALTFEKTGFRMGSFRLDTYPDSLNALRCELRDIGLGDGILPASLEHELRRADSEIPRFAFDRDEATRALTEAIATDLPPINWVQALMKRADECELNRECESSWNGEIHAAILEQAFRINRFVSNGPVDFRYAQAAQIVHAYKPREAPSKMVDFCVFYRPGKGSAEEQAIDDICQTRPAQSINHTDLGDFCKRPIALSIETKRPNVDRDNATLQIGTWQSAQWRSLRHNRGRPLESIEFLPGIIVQGHDWQFVASVLDGNGKSVLLKGLVATASKNSDMICGNVVEMETQMLRALQLRSEAANTTQWGETMFGRATFQISTSDWMICHWADDFMAFRQVLGTLAQLPSDTAKLVSSEDWKTMSGSLGAERTQEQVRELFYPGQSGKPVSAASKRNPKLLQSFDDRGYWDVYERVLHMPALRFADAHRITGMPKEKGRVLFQVLDQVVTWLNPKRTAAVNRRSNTKPDLYAARFREDTWAGVLKIVRWHVSDSRPKWLPMEGSDDKPPEAAPSTQAANLTDAFCNYAAGLTAVQEDEGLYSKLQSSAFRTALATWLPEQCGEEPDSKEMSSGDGARGSRDPHAKDDGSTVVVAAAAAAKSPGVDRPVVDPKPAARPAAKEAAKPTAKPDNATPQPL
ncbi:hypothetical protein O9K51_08602 [Purpureocillium lavendulum]|uniref:PD-(D/E)XK nuclease-like domain-containing protein n=1 Tax=Purpureocillium lavendulum TaxID=1247861 RepID=A0AB34FJS4_9HYPO|nr:hypothetical protein O9K51_08602 [Purpureocillium lavendulum]